MKKTSYLAAGIASLLFAAVAFAATDKAESKPGKCCVKAQTDGKTCTHKCCVDAAKEGNNCTKCGGAGKIETQSNPKK